MPLTRLHGLLAVGGILSVAAAEVTTIVLLRPPNTSRVTAFAPPHEVFLDHVTDAIAVAGGDWTFGDKTTPFSVSEARKDKPQECLSDSSTEQYDLGLFGPASNDPAKTIDEMTRHWQDLGYAVESVADTSDAIEITASVPDGSTLNFFASTGVTTLVTQSPCVKAEG